MRFNLNLSLQIKNSYKEKNLKQEQISLLQYPYLQGKIRESAVYFSETIKTAICKYHSWQMHVNYPNNISSTNAFQTSEIILEIMFKL